MQRFHFALFAFAAATLLSACTKISTSVGHNSIDPLMIVTTSSTIRSRFCWKKSGSKP